MKERVIVDYNFNGTFLFRLGKVSYIKATKPIELHNHGTCMEFVFMLKGRQQYQVGDVWYPVSGGDVFAAFPGEEHSTGENPEEKALFYYLIVDVEKAVSNGWLCVEQEAEKFKSALMNRERRISRLKDWYGTICGELMELCQGSQGEEPGKQRKESGNQPEAAGRDTKIRNFLSMLLLDLAEREADKEKQDADGNIEQAEVYIQNHIKEQLDMDELAALTGLSISRFKLCFLKKTGVPPREYILRKKLEHCKAELETTEKSVTDIAFEYGFSSSQYFSTVFKRYCFISPLDYRKSKQFIMK